MSDDPQLDTIERDLVARLGAPLEQVRARCADCPPPASVRAFAMGTMPDEMAATVRRHVASCEICAAIAADLNDDELTAVTAGEAQRIRARVTAGVQDSPRAAVAVRPSRRGFGWRLAVLGPALAAAAALVLFIWTGRTRVPSTPVSTVAEAPPAAPTIPAALQLDMPELRISAAAVLVTRGEGGSEPYLKDLAAPFDAYRAGKYADAARLLAALETKYPKATEVFFYGGVCRLHEQDTDEALRRFEHARALGEPEFAAEVSFYRALALHRAGRVEAARTEFDRLCAAKGEFQTRACEAARAMIGLPPR
jgi:tetratricopeptide (TPR) repeat protein